MTPNPYAPPKSDLSRGGEYFRPLAFTPVLVCAVMTVAFLVSGYAIAMAIALDQWPFQLSIGNRILAICCGLLFSIPGTAISLIAVFLTPVNYRIGMAVVAPSVVAVAFSYLYWWWVAVIAGC